MLDYGIPVLYALLLWWFSTGAILYLDGLPRYTFRWSLLGATIVLLLSLHGLSLSGPDTSVFCAYAAFTYAVLVWAWHEISFLMGFVTGPWRRECPPDCTGLRRFAYALGAVLYHELAIAATGLLIVALTWGEPNQIGAQTYLLLWGMRLSAKLNLFFGVRTTNQELLPQQLRYLRSFFGDRTMNLFFPVSVTAATLVTAWVVHVAVAAEAGSAEAVGYTCLAALAALGTLEHWLMVVPVRAQMLWDWAVRPRDPADSGEGAEEGAESAAQDGLYGDAKTGVGGPGANRLMLWSRLKIAFGS